MLWDAPWPIHMAVCRGRLRGTTQRSLHSTSGAELLRRFDLRDPSASTPENGSIPGIDRAALPLEASASLPRGLEPTPEWAPDVFDAEDLGDGPVGPGSQYCEFVSLLGLRTLLEDEITELEHSAASCYVPAIPSCDQWGHPRFVPLPRIGSTQQRECSPSLRY